MIPDVISYLSKQKGARLSQLIPESALINAQYRFDSNRFDLLAYSFAKERFYGIHVPQHHTLSSYKKLSEDALWLSRFGGKTILLIPATDKQYDRTIFDEEIASFFEEKYFSLHNQQYLFSTIPQEPLTALTEKTTTIATKLLTDPHLINYVLGKAAKKSEFGKIAKLAYTVGKKLLK